MAQERKKVYIEHGINWLFVYEVEYEDECIVLLNDMGRFHRYDKDRVYTGPVDGYIDFVGSSMIRIDSQPLKLFEINKGA